MRFRPPPQTDPGDGFLRSLRDSVFDLFFATDKLNLSMVSEVLSTTDATVTTLDQFALDDESGYNIHTTVVGVESGAGNRASYDLVGTFYRNGGSATQQGSTTSVHAVESDVNWDCVFDVNGNDVRIRVTGAAATNIDWRASTRVFKLIN